MWKTETKKAEKFCKTSILEWQNMKKKLCVVNGVAGSTLVRVHTMNQKNIKRYPKKLRPEKCVYVRNWDKKKAE